MDRGSLQPYRPRRYDESVWIAAAEEAERQQIAWAASVRGSLPDLARWGALYTETLGALERSWEVSHGDLHQENVLCSGEDSPWLIDWETAGLHQGTKDAVVSALEWSGFMEGPTDLDAFYSFLAAYRSESLLSVEDAELGLNTSFGNWLGCLHFNMQRSLGINTPDPAEQEMGLEQTFSTLRTIRRAEARFPEICEAIRRVCA